MRHVHDPVETRAENVGIAAAVIAVMAVGAWCAGTLFAALDGAPVRLIPDINYMPSARPIPAVQVVAPWTALPDGTRQEIVAVHGRVCEVITRHAGSPDVVAVVAWDACS